MKSMQEQEEIIRGRIIRDMSEGVMAIDFSGVIRFVNPAALQILDMTEESLLGRLFMSCFLIYEENDDFTQTVLDAIYDKTRSHSRTAPYYTGRETRQLHVTTTFLTHEGAQEGVIVVLSDITEMMELRDSLKAMETIRTLNEKLEQRNQLLSKTFGRFLSDKIVRQLLDTPGGLSLGGRKRTVTILMSDLRGFTGLGEQMDAGRLITMLNHYLGEMTEILERRGGTIIEFIGDAIMALFGAPVPTDCHAADAVAAAVEMEARMEDVNRWNAEHGFPALEMGIGVNTGEVIVGNIGSERRTKYGVVGNQVNICGRIESYTVGGQILISPETRRQAGAELQIVGEITVFPKGVDGGLRLAHVTGIGEPYQVFCRNLSVETTPLEEPLPVRFRMLDGKHTEEAFHTGFLTALGDNGAVLRTDCALSLFDNLQIEIDGRPFCKAVRRDGDLWTLRFTSARL